MSESIECVFATTFPIVSSILMVKILIESMHNKLKYHKLHSRIDTDAGLSLLRYTDASQDRERVATHE